MHTSAGSEANDEVAYSSDEYDTIR